MPPKKTRKQPDKAVNKSEAQVSSQGRTRRECDQDEDSDDLSEKEMKIEFDARPVDESDRNGIFTLLGLVLPQQLCAAVTDCVIENIKIGHVMKQFTDSSSDDDESENDDGGDDSLFAITTVLNCQSKKVKDVLTQTLRRLTDDCSDSGSVKLRELISSAQSMAHLGWLINARFDGFPSEVARPSLGSLLDDLQQAANTSYDSFIYMTRALKVDHPSEKTEADSCPMFTQAEDELFEQQASQICHVERKDCDNVVQVYHCVMLLNKEALSGVCRELAKA